MFGYNCVCSQCLQTLCLHPLPPPAAARPPRTCGAPFLFHCHMGVGEGWGERWGGEWYGRRQSGRQQVSRVCSKNNNCVISGFLSKNYICGTGGGGGDLCSPHLTPLFDMQSSCSTYGHCASAYCTTFDLVHNVPRKYLYIYIYIY